jgi:hypothetical protein
MEAAGGVVVPFGEGDRLAFALTALLLLPEVGESLLLPPPHATNT